MQQEVQLSLPLIRYKSQWRRRLRLRLTWKVDLSAGMNDLAVQREEHERYLVGGGAADEGRQRALCKKR